MVSTDWMGEAACSGMESVFDDDLDPFAVEAAVNQCAACPVQTLCLAYALAFERRGARHHVFGGKTALERERLVRGPRARRRVSM